METTIEIGAKNVMARAKTGPEAVMIIQVVMRPEAGMKKQAETRHEAEMRSRVETESERSLTGTGLIDTETRMRRAKMQLTSRSLDVVYASIRLAYTWLTVAASSAKIAIKINVSSYFKSTNFLLYRTNWSIR